MIGKTPQTPHVLILGAGLGGLTLAQSLRQKGISFEIFERDTGLHSRFQGWSISLHWMLKDLVDSTPDDLPPIEVTSNLLQLDLPAEACFYKGETKQLSMRGGVDGPLIRANRSRLRDWLATNIDIQWNRKVTRIEETEDAVKVVFEDGSIATGDVLVGADGVNSIVRTHLLSSKDILTTLPVQFITGEPVLNKPQYEQQLSLAHSAYVVMDETLSDGSRLFVGVNAISEDLESANYYWFLSRPNSNTSTSWKTQSSQRELLQMALEWSQWLPDKFKEIIEVTKVQDMMAPSFIVKDLLLDGLPNKRITLLGDAAHAMSPFRGEGGNHAMKDALNLGRALAKVDGTNLLPLLKEYQDEMLLRSGEAVRKSRAATLDDGSGTMEGWTSWNSRK